MGNYKIMHGNNVIAAADAGKALGVSGDAVSACAREITYSTLTEE